MVLTSVHHVYGALMYNTPYRLHVLFFSIPVLLITIILGKMLDKLQARRFLYVFRIYAAIIFIFSVLLIGLYEGVYNHIAKNLAFFSGMCKQALDTFFPPGIYVMPNDLIFEFTGVAQGVVGVWLAMQFVMLLKRWKLAKS